MGEVALVSIKSPIYESKKIYLNTLYDENAVCHLALGNYAKMVLDGVENMSEEELEKKAVNKSSIHVDFMIGSNELCVKGITKDDKVIDLMEKGEWVI